MNGIARCGKGWQVLNIDPKYIIKDAKSGKDLVKYAGLLLAAHDDLKSIRVTVVQSPSPQNGELAVCQADVIYKDQLWTEVGDASPATGQRVSGALVRLAATRAKARALRDALGLDMLAAEELEGSVDSRPVGEPPARTRTRASRSAVAPHAPFIPVSGASIKIIESYGAQLGLNGNLLAAVSGKVGRVIKDWPQLEQAEADSIIMQMSRAVAEKLVGGKDGLA